MFVKLVTIGFLMIAGLSNIAEAKSKPKFLPIPVPLAVPTPAPDPENMLDLDLSTGGRVTIQLRPDKAPGHIARIKALARAGFYDGLVFHRVIEGFMAQTGDPRGTGEGGSPLPDLKAEFNDLPHLRGTVSMARTDQPDTANSQFFICFQPVMKLDGKYSVIGRVTSGMQFVDLIALGEPPETPSKIIHAFIEADGANAARVPLVVPPPSAAVAPEVAPPPAPAEPAPAPVKKRKKFKLF
jgi:cyclophilin family peptidyl-prolyl cis-trans isomerase